MESLDIRKLNARINEIHEAIKEIREYISLPEEKFWEDHRNILAIEQLLLRAIEATGGICLHLAAKKLKKGAESLAHCFEILGESLIDKKLADSLIKMSRFRNILIHKYWEIDERRIYEYAKNNLEDFENFIKAVNQFLKP